MNHVNGTAHGPLCVGHPLSLSAPPLMSWVVSQRSSAPTGTGAARRVGGGVDIPTECRSMGAFRVACRSTGSPRSLSQ